MRWLRRANGEVMRVDEEGELVVFKLKVKVKALLTVIKGECQLDPRG